MNNISIHLWGFCFRILFWCACIFFTITRMRVHGASVAVWHKEKILLVQKSYRKEWSIPGGMLNREETWKQAAIRETFEEVGLRIPSQDLVYIAEVPGDLGPHDRVRLFEVQMDPPLDVKIDQREIIKAEFVTLETALQRDLNQNVAAYLRSRKGH